MIYYTSRPTFSTPASSINKDTTPLPLVVSSTDQAYVVKCQVPGIQKDQIHIGIEDQYLHIKTEQYMNEEDHIVYNEWPLGALERRFKLPSDADDEQVTASVDNGVLTIEMGKKTKKRQVTIQ